MKTSKYPPAIRRNKLLSLFNTAIASLAVLALSAVSARAFTNYLGNAGFETGTAAPWLDTYAASHSIDSTDGYVYNSGNTIHEPAHSGKWTIKQWGDYWGAFWQAHTIYQLIPAAPGSTWSADIWGYTATPDNIKGQNWIQLQVFFMNSATNVISGGDYYSAVIDTNSPVNTWMHIVATNSMDGTTNLPAPDGTAFVRFGLIFNQDPNQSGGSIYWDDANLIKTAASDPEISSSPQDLTVVYGQTATFTVLASGRTPLSYAWQKDGAPISNGGRISGATTATLSIANATTADQAAYSVTVSDAAGSLPSPASGYLTVLDPGIVTNPVSLQKIEGQTATFTVAAAGSGTLTYSWLKGSDPLSNGGRISGANTATLTIANVTVADIGSYSVIVAGAGQMQSTVATLYVTTAAEASQLIRNGGFESGFAYWTSWNGAAVVTAPAGGETNYDGAQIAEVYSTGNGTWNGFNQSFPAVPGNVYRASAWCLVSSGAVIAGSSTTWLEINFYNQGNIITSFQSPVISSNSEVGVWTNLVVPYAVAPAGTDETRCQINYHAGDGGGALYLDDVTFWLRIPVTIVPSFNKPNLVLSFPTQVGVTYQILYKNDFADATWQVLQTVNGDLSGQANVPTPTIPTKRFYRVNALW
jgi:hypothetical protein